MPRPRPIYTEQLFPRKRIFVGPTDGKKTLAKSAKVFTGFLDPHVEDFDQPVAATPRMEVQVHKLIRNREAPRVFGNFGVPPGLVCLGQTQIPEFVECHPKRLRDGAFETLMIFKKDPENKDDRDLSNIIVAIIRMASLGPELVLGPYDYRTIWHADWEHWFVIPKVAKEQGKK